MKILHLNENCLHFFDLDNFPIGSVTQLKLSNNYLTEISIYALQNNFPNALDDFYFDGNNIHCSNTKKLINLIGKQKLRVTYIDHNVPNIMGIQCRVDEEDIRKLETKCESTNKSDIIRISNTSINRTTTSPSSMAMKTNDNHQNTDNSKRYYFSASIFQFNLYFNRNTSASSN